MELNEIMRINMKKQVLTLFTLAAMAFASAFAATENTNTNSIAPTLQVNATVQKAIRLTLSQGSQCAITSPGSGGQDYSISFGNVDALGINDPACGAKFAPATPGTDAAVYYSDYQLTPVFTNQNATTNTISAHVSNNFATLSGILSVVQANTQPASAAGLTAMSTSGASPTSVVTNAANNTAVTRYIGVSVLPTNSSSAAVNGSDSATVTYTLTVN